MRKGVFFITIIFFIISAASLSAQCRMRKGLNKCYYNDGQLYYVYLSNKALQNLKRAKLLVSIHGYTGRLRTWRGIKRVRRAALRWKNIADKKGLIVIAPHFDYVRFNNDYQRLNVRGLRSDIRLNNIIKSIKNQFIKLSGKKIYLFGFSGGGQFVHRYAAIHPEKVARAVAGGAGWYMWPDMRYYYPIGIKVGIAIKNFKINLHGLCRTRLLVLVGEKDKSSGAFRKRKGRINLTVTQGESRIARGKNWVRIMAQYARKNRIPCRISFGAVPNTGHRINRRFKRIASTYLFY